MELTAACLDRIAGEKIVWCQEVLSPDVTDGNWLADESFASVMRSATYFDKTTIFVRWIFALQTPKLISNPADASAPLTIVVSWREAKPVADAIQCLHTGKEEGILRPDVKRAALGPGAGAAARRLKKLIVIVRERFRVRVQNWRDKACACNPDLVIHIVTSLPDFLVALASKPSPRKSETVPFAFSTDPKANLRARLSAADEGETVPFALSTDLKANLRALLYAADEGLEGGDAGGRGREPSLAAPLRLPLAEHKDPDTFAREIPLQVRDALRPRPPSIGEPAFLVRSGFGAASPILAQVKGQPLESSVEKKAPLNFCGPSWTIVSL